MALNIIKFEDKVSLKDNPVAEINKVTADNMNEIKNALNNLIFPIGSVIINASESFDPNSSYDGTWEQFAKGQTLVGVDVDQEEFNTVEKIGGEKTHKLLPKEMPKHTHGMKYGFGSGSSSTYNASVTNKSISQTIEGTENLETGGDEPHNNLQPYITVYFWKRVA